MQKIVSLFQRNYETDRLVRDEVVLGAEWVADGEGVATVKWDGTPCLIRDGRMFKRYDAKPDRKTGAVKLPPDFEQSGNADPVTGRVQGWVPVGDGPDDRWFREAFAAEPELPNGTYELVGPKVQRNLHGLESHTLIPHGQDLIGDAPRDFDGIRQYLSENAIEGIVWHHPDGRMVKIKARDFGLSWPPNP